MKIRRVVYQSTKGAGVSRKRGIELTESDRSVVRWIGEQYMVSLTLLEFLLRRARTHYRIGGNYRANIYRTLKRWKDSGFADYGVVDREVRVWLTTEGMRWAGLPYRGGKHNQSEHTESIALVRLYLEERLGDDLDRWVDVRAFKGLPVTFEYDPDGVAIVGGEFVPIEIELVNKRWVGTKNKVDWYRQNFANVWYYTSAEVERMMERNLLEDDVIKTRPLEEVRQWLIARFTPNGDTPTA